MNKIPKDSNKYMFNYVRRLLTGYRRAEKLVNGKLMVFSYLGKLVIFNPVGMIEELSFKLKEKGLARFGEEQEVDGLLKNFLSLRQGMSPSTKVKINLKNEKLESHRYVRKIGEVSCSYYEFYLDHVLIAVFLRKYDYGRDYKDTVHRFLPAFSARLVNPESKYLVELDNVKSKVFVEVFGHTHIWLVKDMEKIDRLLDAAKNQPVTL